MVLLADTVRHAGASDPGDLLTLNDADASGVCRAVHCDLSANSRQSQYFACYVINGSSAADDCLPGRNPKLAEGIVEELLIAFLRDDQGQDLIEYTLLLAFVCLATAALFISSGGSLSAIWVTANSQLTTANAASAS